MRFNHTAPPIDFNKMTLDMPRVIRKLQGLGMRKLPTNNGHEMYEFPLELVRDRNRKRWWRAGSPSDVNACRNQIRDLNKILKDLPSLMGCRTFKEIEENVVPVAPETVLAEKLATALANPEPIPETVIEEVVEDARKKIEAMPKAESQGMTVPTLPQQTPQFGFGNMLRTNVERIQKELTLEMKAIEEAEFKLEEMREEIKTREAQIATRKMAFKKAAEWVDQANLVLVGVDDVAVFIKPDPLPKALTPTPKTASTAIQGIKGVALARLAEGYLLENPGRAIDCEEIRAALRRRGHIINNDDMSKAVAYMIKMPGARAERAKHGFYHIPPSLHTHRG